MYFRLEAATPECRLRPDRDRVAGRELAYFIPDHLEWTQLNYGQGEGQALIAGAEFGFYFPGGEGVAVRLHRGELEDGAFDSILHDIGEHLFGPGRFRIVAAGDD